jgi:hypothetical protein
MRAAGDVRWGGNNATAVKKEEDEEVACSHFGPVCEMCETLMFDFPRADRGFFPCQPWTPEGAFPLWP